MDTVVDIIPTGESVIPVKADPTAPIDLLGRQEIVDRIMKILEVISEKKSSCTFALNGAWGTGKTFVLNMLMNQLWEYHSDKYIVFHYNCWQYDYYEEPLIAIVAAMLDSVDEENHLLPENLRDKAKAGMELAKPVLQKIANDFVKNKIGVDLTEVVSNVKDFKESIESEEQKRADARSFDEFYSFKKAIGQAQDEIRKLTKDRTLVVVVDELDRCLPSYAIKVLERLHHLFSGINNLAVIMAVDKNQLEHTVNQIFGNNTNTSHYLRKFISYELELDVGFIEKGAMYNKYSGFFNMFTRPRAINQFPTTEFIASLLSDIPIRMQEQIINRIKTVHNLLFSDSLKDESFLCCELLWIILVEVYGIGNNSPFFYKNVLDEEGEPGFKLNIDTKNRLSYFFEKYWSSDFVIVGTQYSSRGIVQVLQGNGVMQKLIIYYLSRLINYPNADQTFYLDFDVDNFDIDYRNNVYHLKEAIKLLITFK